MSTFHIGIIIVTSFIMVINLFAVTVCVRSSQISQVEEKHVAEMDQYIEEFKRPRLPKMNNLSDTMTGQNGIVMKSKRSRPVQL